MATSCPDKQSSKTQKSDVAQEDNPVEHRCGLGSCQPECAQKCHNVVCLLVVLCFMILLQGNYTL